MTDRTIDESDLGFVVKMVKDRVIKQVIMTKERVFKAFDTDLSTPPSIFLCCSEYVAEEMFPQGSIIIAVLGGAMRLAEGCLMSAESDTASTFLRRQIMEAQKEHPDFPVILIVDAPCITLNTEGPLDVVQQIRDMLSGLDASNLGSKTEVSCFLRINTSSGGTYYKVDRSLWRQWYRNYEVNVLGSQDDDDPGADDGLGRIEMHNSEDLADLDPDDRARTIDLDPDGPMVVDSVAAPDVSLDSDAMASYRESQHDVSNDSSRRKG